MKQSARRVLALAFQVNQYPNNEEKKNLAVVCEMDYLQVCNWFKNRRMREKRLLKEAAASQRRDAAGPAISPTDSSVSAAVSELSTLQENSNTAM